MQYGRNKTRTMVALKILFVWGVSIAISSPICIYGFVDHSTVLNDHLCVPTLSEFIIYGSIFAFYIPLFIMILTYLLTIKILVRNQSLMRTIERSDLRLRPRHNTSLAKSCQVATFVSPPSSESRKSQIVTEVSSLGRTPNRERVNLPGFENFGIPIPESKLSTESIYTDIQQTSLENVSDHEKDTSCDNLSDHEKPFNDNVNLRDSISINVVPDMKEANSDSDNDENTSLLKSREVPRIVTTSQPASPVAKFRYRTNTDIIANFPTTHSSLKIPKTSPNLQASISCSNFSRDCATELGLFNSSPNSGSGLNRDYKSLEWSQNFYQIQEEMDQCIRETLRERKQENTKEKTPDLSLNKNSLNSSAQKDDNGIVRKDKLNPENLSRNLSESGDSTDDADSSSDNNSDLITIKLYPKSVYMYKLEVPQKSSKPNSPVQSPTKGTTRIPNGHIKSDTESCLEISSINSEKIAVNRIIRRRKGSSFTTFIRNVRKHRNFLSNKTTTNEKKASKVLGIIFAVFVILWTPFFIANILSAICPSCMANVSPEVLSAFVWMGYVASLANPIIYTMFNTAFRRTFVKILTCKMCKKDHQTSRFHPSSYPSYPASAASVYTDRRQTVTMLVNNNTDSRRTSDYLSTNGIHK